MNVNKLKGKMVENEFTVEKLANKIGIDRATFYRRLNSNGETFTIKEANLISIALGLTADEVNAIFFKETVA